MPLNNYTFDMPLGFAGMIADSSQKVTDSFAAEGVIPYGVAVVRGTDPVNQAKVVTAADDLDNFVGISHSTHMQIQNESGEVQYLDKDTVNVLSFGRVWVNVTEAVTAGTEAQVVATGADAGKFATTGTAVTNKRLTFLTSTTAAGLAVVEIR